MQGGSKEANLWEFETKVADLLRSLAVSLQLSMLLPAMLLVGGCASLLFPSALGSRDTAFVLAALTVTVSYLFNAFNMPLIRALEGYHTEGLPLTEALRAYQKLKYLAHHQQIDAGEQAWREVFKLENLLQLRGRLSPEVKVQLALWKKEWDYLRVREQERLEERFPPTYDRITATGFGNTIAAFENYPGHRYYINMPVLWPRFVPVLQENKYAAFIEGEKALLDFLINLLAVCGFIWLVALSVFSFTRRLEAGLLLVVAPVLSVVLYKGSCVAALNWGMTIRSAFDLYRFELKRALNLRLWPKAKFSDERKMWQEISEFLARGSNKDYDGFDYAVLTPGGRGNEQTRG
jgi:hypothetical protein